MVKRDNGVVKIIHRMKVEVIDEYSLLFTDTEVNNYFSIYHASEYPAPKIQVILFPDICENPREVTSALLGGG